MGGGAVTNFFSKKFPEAFFHGIDINPKYIKIARLNKLPNTKFSVLDITNLRLNHKNIDGIICLQTLSWMKNYKKPLINMFQVKPKWILITSLFYDGPVDTEIVIKDFSRTMGSSKFRRSFYNIYSIDLIEAYAKKFTYTLDKYEPFIFPFDLAKPNEKGMGTYTKKLSDGSRIQISGPLLMPWYTLLFRKERR